MTLPGIDLNTVDGQLGLVEPAPDTPLVLGPAIAGAPYVLNTFAQPNDLESSLVAGPAVTCAAHILDVAGGSVDVMLTQASVAGVIGAITQAGSGPAITAAILQRDVAKAWQIDDPAGTPAYVDETGDTNSAAAGDVDPWPASEAVGDQFAIGFNAPFRSFSVTIGTAGVGGTLTFKYWDGTQWTAVTGLTDASTGFTAGTSTYDVTFTMPTDWVARSINGSADLFYLVAEVAGTYSTNPVLSRVRITNHGPNDHYTAIVQVVAGGALGTATFRYTLDGVNYGDVRTIPAGGSYDISNAGLSLTFGAGTYVAGTTYSFTAKPPTFNAADLDRARDALLLLNRRWKIPVYAGMAASAAAAATLASAIIGHADDLADTFRLNRPFVHCGDDTEANVLTSFGGGAIEDLRLALFAEKDRLQVRNPIEGWRKPFLPTVYNAAAMATAFTRGTNIGWHGIGTPTTGGRKPRVSAVSFDERKSGESYHAEKINAPTSRVGAAGFYFTNGLLKSPAGSDFRYIHWGLAFDLACETVVDALLPYINASLRVNPDGSGTIHPLDAARINKQVNASLRAAVLEPLTEQGFAGFFSAAEFKVDETYNILLNKKLRGDLRCVPLANTEQVEITAGLAASLANETEETTTEEEAA